MAAHTKRLIIIVATFCAFAVPDFAFGKTCEDEAGTVDERYAKVKGNGQTDSDNSVAFTKLLNDAYTPFLRNFESSVYRIPIHRMKVIAKELAPSLREQTRLRTELVQGSGFNAGFDGYLVGNLYLFAPYTNFNREPLRKLLVTAMVLTRLEKTGELNLREELLNESEQLLQERTYAENDLESQMSLSYHALMQSVSALTANPVLSWLPDAMLKDVMKPQGTCPSLVVMHSVMLPPALLGANGNERYRARPVEDVGGHLKVTSDFRNFIKNHKAEWAEKEGHKKYEFGHGCPVGHTRKDDLYSGLQSFTNAVLWVYEAIEWDI